MTAEDGHLSKWEQIQHFILDYSVPLLTGIVIALIFANAAWDDYEYMFGKHHAWFFETDYDDRKLFDHEINILFLVNDIFMVFFFGLATTEVTTLLQPPGAILLLGRWWKRSSLVAPWTRQPVH